MTVTLQQLKESDQVCSNEDYAGYAEHQFLQAFDQLCAEYGGLRNGIAKAEQLIKEQVQ